MLYFSPTKIDRKLPFIMVFGRYIRIYMDVGFFVYECLCGDGLSPCSMAWAQDDAMLVAALHKPTQSVILHQ